MAGLHIPSLHQNRDGAGFVLSSSFPKTSASQDWLKGSICFNARRGGKGCNKVDPACLPPPTTEKLLLECESRAASPMLLPPESPHPGRSTLEERGILGLSTPKQVRRTLAQRGQSANPQPSSLEPRHWALTVIPGQALKRPDALANISTPSDPHREAAQRSQREREGALPRSPSGGLCFHVCRYWREAEPAVLRHLPEPAGRASMKVAAGRAPQAFAQGEGAYRQSLPGLATTTLRPTPTQAEPIFLSF